MDKYKLDEELGNGRYATVYLANERSTNKWVCLKKVQLTDDNMIPSFLEQILNGVSHCHSHGIIHRDLKPENLLIDTKTDQLKLADFRLARGFVSSDMRLSPEVVTLSYRAPEIIFGSNQYSYAVDMWSVGCIFAEMVNKSPLFNGNFEIAVMDDICRKMGTPSEETWPGVSSLQGFFPIEPWQAQDLASFVPELEAVGVDLLSKLLCMDPDKRIKAMRLWSTPILGLSSTS